MHAHRFSGKGKTFSFSIAFKAALVKTQYPVQLVPIDISPVVKQPEREADTSVIGGQE
jgi:hypothetical protein